MQREKTTNTRLRSQLRLLKNHNHTEKVEVLKRLAPDYCKTVGIDQGELEDRANLEKRIAEQDKEIKELKRQAQEAKETDSQAKKASPGAHRQRCCCFCRLLLMH